MQACTPDGLTVHPSTHAIYEGARHTGMRSEKGIKLLLSRNPDLEPNAFTVAARESRGLIQILFAVSNLSGNSEAESLLDYFFPLPVVWA